MKEGRVDGTNRVFLAEVLGSILPEVGMERKAGRGEDLVVRYKGHSMLN